MKIKTTQIIEKTAARLRIVAGVRYGEEEIPNDFPGRVADTWIAVIDVATGQIGGWPAGVAADMHLTVKDGGSYYLLDESGRVIAAREDNYVPHGIVPGSYGDTIELKINIDGVITNWPKDPDTDGFAATP